VDYLCAEELETLNRTVTAYLEFAELQARNRRPMHMAEWIAKLNDLLRLSERKILDHAGQVSHELALRKAEVEYEKWRAIADGKPQPVDRDFDRAVFLVCDCHGQRSSVLQEALPLFGFRHRGPPANARSMHRRCIGHLLLTGWAPPPLPRSSGWPERKGPTKFSSARVCHMRTRCIAKLPHVRMATVSLENFVGRLPRRTGPASA
jgi:hypothetical protein